MAPVRQFDQLGGGEMPVLVCDEDGDRTTRLGQAVPGPIEGADDGIVFGHDPTLSH